MIVIDRKANGNNLPIHFNFQDVKYPSASWTISIGKTQYATAKNEEIFLTFAKNTKLVFNLKLYTRHPSANKLAVYFEHEITDVPASDQPWRRRGSDAMPGYPTLTWQLFESLEGSGYKHVFYFR